MNRPPPVVLPPSSPKSPLRFSAIGDAFRLFKAEPLVWMVHSLPATILLTLASYEGLLVTDSMMKSIEQSGLMNDPTGAQLTFSQSQTSAFLLSMELNVAGLWMVFFTGAAVANAIRKQWAGQSLETKDIFDFGGRGLQALFISAAMTALIVTGYMSCYFPGIFAEGFSMTANLRSVDRKESMGQAFLGSYRRNGSETFTRGMTVHALLLILLVASLIPFVGFLIGIPIYNITRGLYYLRLTAQEEGRYGDA